MLYRQVYVCYTETCVCYTEMCVCYTEMCMLYKDVYVIQTCVCYTETDDNDKIDEMHNKRRRLAAFAKLVTCNIIPIKNAIEIFKNYVKVYLNVNRGH